MIWSVCTWRHQILTSKSKEPLKVLSSSGIRSTNKFIFAYNFPASLFQALCQWRIKKAGGRRVGSGREKGGLWSRLSLAPFFDRPHWPRAWNRLLSSSVASFVWKPAHFEFRSYGDAWHEAWSMKHEAWSMKHEAWRSRLSKNISRFLAILGKLLV